MRQIKNGKVQWYVEEENKNYTDNNSSVVVEILIIIITIIIITITMEFSKRIEENVSLIF